MQSPAAAEIVAGRTTAARDPELRLPPPADPERFSFLVLGDSGDSAAQRAPITSQIAVAQELVEDLIPSGAAQFVLHTGDLVYPCGERHLYEANFLRPYAGLLSPVASEENTPTFRVPFLPVPGNHDYADLHPWVRSVVRAPLLGRALRTFSERAFSYPLPSVGSRLGLGYWEVFVEPHPPAEGPLDYSPGSYTRLPNRYYRFRYGTAEFFALDSNSLLETEGNGDPVQLQWLEQALANSVAERPGGWRVLYLHHPPWTTVANYVEQAAVHAIRSLLVPLLADRVHLVLAGHAHTFEWLQTEALPHCGLFVTGGGGQGHLTRSVLAPAVSARYPERVAALWASGLVEAANAGRGPVAADGEAGRLHHYLRVEVTPDRLLVRPVGVRRLQAGRYRREEPMPAFHATAPPVEAWHSRILGGVEIRRRAAPMPLWE
jgi:hypothetical protein